MFPMVTEVEEVRRGRAALLEAHEQLAQSGQPARLADRDRDDG